MAQASRIEWTQTTWNPVAGCTKVSAGCKNCYAERMARRLAAMASAALDRGASPGRTANYLPVIDRRGAWSGQILQDVEALDDPKKWKEPRVVFVNSMSDLFHENVSFAFVQAVFKTMNECPRHQFQVLTKRPHIAKQYSPSLKWTHNIWLGTSVENADVQERVEHLRETGAHVKFLSVEPLLGPIPRLPISGISWVIVGGESGPGARPMKPEWVQQIRDRCRRLGVAFFFKQWGGTNKKRTGRILDGREWNEMPGSRIEHPRATKSQVAIGV